jgi:AraC-like DNA-binding protein
MATTCESPRFHIEGDDRLAFLAHVHWSAEPDITRYDTGPLPIAALRQHRVRATGTVEVMGDAPAAIDWDLLFVNRNGTGTLGIDFCGDKREVQVHRDLCCLFPAGADNSLHFDARGGAFALYCEPGVLSAPGGAGPREPAPILGRRMPRVAHLLGLIESELQRPGLGTGLMIDGLLRAIAGLLAGRDEGALAAECERIYLSPGKLRRVLDFVEAHLDAPIGLEDLAREAGLSANHFLRVFKLSTGETPYHYLRSRRIERAREMLAAGTMPLAELALECGFANQAHFTAAFSRELGISPGRYRRAVRV